ncbi:hypothetical protein ACH6CV_17555 [Bacillota bacterium Meth-B3]|nr:hypothetical protein [Christensenellaceae bacterium]MEA5065410.1 hypothetical protein [Eubacteriales bacterium]MEA5069534.1 hypothetical protein [Christensenellaceae bacterium]
MIRNAQRYRIGPGAASLIMIVVVLCLTVLSLLALIGARADYRLAERSREMVASYYDADARTQRALAALDSALIAARAEHADEQGYFGAVRHNLPEGWMPVGDVLRFTADAGAGRALVMAVELLPPGAAERYRVTSVTLEGDMTWEDQPIEGLLGAD